MKLVLHIGFHKTGTSALQKFCRLNRDNLAGYGYLYPKTGISEIQFPSTPSSEGGHRGLSDIFATPTNEISRHKLESIISETTKYKNIHNVIISSEIFSEPNKKISRNVCSVLNEYFNEIKIITYLRRQDLYAETMYREVLCWSGRKEQRNFEQFQREFLPPWLDYKSRIEAWGNIFGPDKLIVKSYDDRQYQNIIEDFFKSIGLAQINESGFDSMPDINPSLPVDLVPLLLGLNQLYLTREQKSEATQLIFEKLSCSNYKVARKKLLSDSLYREYVDTYGPMNRDIASVYSMKFDEYFTFRNSVDTYPDIKHELTLKPEQIEYILEYYKAESEKTLENIRNSPRRDVNKGRIGISCLLNESPDQTRIFVKYHLALGATKIRLYFDNPDDPMADYDFGTTAVEIIRCNEGFWYRHLGREPRNNAEKLTVCHSEGLKDLLQEEDIDWAINLDADELLYVSPKTTLQEYLTNRPAHLDQIIVRPLEAIFITEENTDTFSSKYFKVPRIRVRNEWPRANNVHISRLSFLLFSTLYRFNKVWLARLLLQRLTNHICLFFPWMGSDEKLYKEYMPVLSNVMRNGFLAHQKGRTFSRHGLFLDDVTSHRPRPNSIRQNVQWQNNTIFVLHYDAVDYSAWHLKWYRRVFGHTSVTTIHQKRNIQQDMFYDAYLNGPGAVKKLFNDLYVFPVNSIKKFEKKGLVVKLSLPLLETIKRGN